MKPDRIEVKKAVVTKEKSRTVIISSIKKVSKKNVVYNISSCYSSRVLSERIKTQSLIASAKGTRLRHKLSLTLRITRINRVRDDDSTGLYIVCKLPITFPKLISQHAFFFSFFFYSGASSRCSIGNFSFDDLLLYVVLGRLRFAVVAYYLARRLSKADLKARVASMMEVRLEVF